MKKITFLLYGVFLLVSFTAFAQSGGIKGKVLDGSFPLPGATVQLNGTQKNASTDFEGNYNITGISPGSYEVVAAYLGYEKTTQSIIVEAGKITAVSDILMQPISNELNEVVVTSTASRLSEAK